jgi:enoyl-CoA hydratase/carnithine racemase
MTTDQMKTEIYDGIMTMTLTQPEKKNALSKAMYKAMSDGLETAEKDPNPSGRLREILQLEAGRHGLPLQCDPA